MSLRTLNIQIALYVDGDEISGVAALGDGPGTRFHGWLGLMSAVDALVVPGTEAPPGAVASPPPDAGEERTRTEH